MSGPHPDLYSRTPEPVRSPERWCGAGDGRGMEGAGNLLPEGKNFCFHRENDVYEEWAGAPSFCVPSAPACSLIDFQAHDCEVNAVHLRVFVRVSARVFVRVLYFYWRLTMTQKTSQRRAFSRWWLRMSCPWERGTYEGPEGEVGFEVQVTGGGAKGDSVTSCGFVRTVGDCKERKYDYTVSERMWKQQCVMEVDCKGAVGTHVRVVLPGA